MSPKKITHYRGLFGTGVIAGLSVSVTAAILLTFFPSGSTFAAGTKAYDAANITKVKEQFNNSKTTLEDLSALYHSTTNSIFNDYIDLFTKGKGTLVSVKDDKECQATGETMNISTYCLFLRVDDLYEAYNNTLKFRQQTALKEIEHILQGNNSQTVSSNLYEARKNWIEREFASAKKALDGGLKAYSELLTQQPLHLEYEKTIKLLVKYYDHLVDVRKKVDTYPNRFHDVTTPYCN